MSAATRSETAGLECATSTRGPGGRDDQERSGRERRSVEALARQALAVLAARVAVDHGQDQHMAEFFNAIVSKDELKHQTALAKLMSTGVSSEEICDKYIPEAARLLGQHWVDDTLSFVEVTVGASRLQAMARALAGDGASSAAIIPLGKKILLAVPSFEDHTLGAFVAANQFRRYGLWVHMAIDVDPTELVELADAEGFSMIGLSVARQRSLDPVHMLIDQIRGVKTIQAPVVLGGAVTGLDLDVAAATGADLVSARPREALDFCGLATQRSTAAILEKLM